MDFHIVTLFPEFFHSPVTCGLLAKAKKQGIIDTLFVNPRDFTTDAHHTVDDRPYGGGPGMVMLCDPLVKAVKSIENPGRIICLTPQGKPFGQAMAEDLAGERALTLVCGRYEGYDTRFTEILPVEEVSVGDFVLNGGEAAALCVLESVARLVPGFMGHKESAVEESFSAGLLEYPHYTRPAEYEGYKVPLVLQTGDHKKIAVWRRQESLRLTFKNRPDLLTGVVLQAEDLRFLQDLYSTGERPRLGKNLYLALLHAPVLNKFQETLAVSLTNLDVHDIARVSCTFGLGGYYIATPLTDQRVLLDKLIAHWVNGPGKKANKDRAEALGLIRAATDLAEVVADITRRSGQSPKIVATSARGSGDMSPLSVRQWLKESPVLLLLGTGHGLAPEILEQAHGVLSPIRPFGSYNHLSVRSATAMMVDRLLGDVL